MKKALINIDYTNDFVAADGALTCGEPGQKIEKSIVGITEQFINNNDYVVFAIDLHKKDDPYHPETSLFPLITSKAPRARAIRSTPECLCRKQKQSCHSLDGQNKIFSICRNGPGTETEGKGNQ